jgi:hypothetical protein
MRYSPPPLRAFSLCLIGGLCMAFAALSYAADKSKAVYVGSEKCKECHEEQYASYHKYSRKAHSFQSIKKMQPKLTAAEFEKCFECHTTGHGKPGGFVSEAKTPQLRNAGCEACHGPGSVHAESQDPKDIKSKLTAEDCMTCHNEERVGSFKYRPLIYGGGH